ncbi:MAG: hypothetical protein EBR82_80570 [Caulobacteraceae bacterium]|nr:hypothetical protein [Caulobacteraceae bacterium]
MAGVVQFGVGLNGKRSTRFDPMVLQIMMDQLREYAPNVAAQIEKRELKDAAELGESALKAEVQTLGQVSGNLLRAVALKTKTYTNNRNGIPVCVAIVGFRRSGTGDTRKASGSKIQIGNDRAFHSHLVEFGTQRRFPGKSRIIKQQRRVVGGRKTTEVLRRKDFVRAKSVVMSSWNTTKAFGNKFIARVRPDVGLGRMPALHPVENAFYASKNAMQEALFSGIENAADKAFNQFQSGLP